MTIQNIMTTPTLTELVLNASELLEKLLKLTSNNGKKKEIDDIITKMNENTKTFQQTASSLQKEWFTEYEKILGKQNKIRMREIQQQFLAAGNLAIDKILPKHLGIIMQLDSSSTSSVHIIEEIQYDEWLKLAKNVCKNKKLEIKIPGNNKAQCLINISNIEMYINAIRAEKENAYGTIPAKPEIPYETMPVNPESKYGVLPAKREPVVGTYVPNPYAEQPGVPGNYTSIPGNYQKTPPPSYGDVPGTPPYGNLPEGYKPDNQAKLTISTTAEHQRQLRIEVLKMRVSGAPIRVPQINVDHGTIIFESSAKVLAAIGSLLNQTRIVPTTTLVPRIPLSQTNVLVANRQFEIGELVAYYDGRLVSAENARAIEAMSSMHTLHTLRAGLWAIVGYDNPEDVPVNGGLASFAADNIDLCATARTQQECRIPHTKINTQLMTLTNAQNALSSDRDYQPEHAFLVLVATSVISKNQSIFYRHVAFAPYILTDDSS